MTSGGVGSIRGQIRIDAKQALAEYAAVRSANAKTRASLNSASSTFAKVGVASLAAAAPIALLFKAAVGAAAEFEKKIDFFGAVTNASKADMEAVAQKAMDMSKTTVYSASQMADAFVEFGKAGIATKDILNGVADATANLAQAADIKVQDAANIIVSTMSTFKIAADQTNHISDQIAGAANASIIDVADLATSLKYAGGIAAATKVPFESVVTAIALLGNAGIKGSTAGTSLRQIMVSLVAQTPKATQQLKDLGIITKKNTNLFINQRGQIKPLSEIFQILQDHTRKLTDAQRLAALKIIFNSRALSSANILLREGSKGFDKMAASIGKVSAADVASKRLDNLAGDITHLKNTIQTTLIQVGGPLQSALRPFVKFLTKLLQLFGALPAPVQKFIIMLLLAVGAFLVVFGSIALMLSAFLRIIVVFREFRAALLLLRGGIGVVITAFRLLSVALLTNPIFLVIAAVILIVGAFIYFWKTSAKFRAFWKKLWKDIKDIAEKVWGALKTAFHATIDFIVKTAKKVWNGIKTYLLQPVLDAWHAVVNAFNTAKRWIGNAIKNIINFVKKHWTLIIAIILGPLGLLIDLIHKHWDTIVRGTKAAWKAVSDAVKAAIAAVIASAQAVADFFVGLWNTISNAVVTAWNAITSFLSGAWHTIASVATSVWNAIVSFFTTIWNGIVAAARAIFSPIISFFSSIWNGVYNVVAPAVRAVFNVVSSVFHAVWNTVVTIWNGIVGAISSAASSIASVVSSIVSGIIGAFADAGSWLLNAGKAIVEGLWNGISGAAGWLYDKVSGFASDVWSKFSDFFGISSPSRLMHWAGDMLVRGLERGVTKRKKYAVAAAQAMAKEVANASNVQAKYSLLAEKSGINATRFAASKAPQASIGTAGKVQVHVTDNRAAVKQGSTVGRHTEIHQVLIQNPAKEPASDSLYHTVQKVLEDVI